MQKTKPNPAVLERRQLAEAVQQKLIPWAQALKDRDVAVASQLHTLPLNVRVQAHAGTPLPRKGPERGSIVTTWPETRLESASSPILCCVLDGEADLRIGILEDSLPGPGVMDGGAARKGIDLKGHQYVSLALPERAFLFIPPDMPGPDNSGPHWERPNAERAFSRIFWLRTTPKGAFCVICTSRNGVHLSHGQLYLPDIRIHQLLECLGEELLGRAAGRALAVPSLLLALVLRVQNGLGRKQGAIMDPGVIEGTVASGQGNSILSKQDPVQRAQAYIEENLQENIDLKAIATHAFVAPSQLNRLCNAELGMSVMKYLTHRRLEAAKNLLVQTGLSIQQVGVFSGFANAANFSHVFQKHVGCSPSAYRKGNPGYHS